MSREAAAPADEVVSIDAASSNNPPIESLNGIGPARAKQFKKLGLHRLNDLLEFFPRTYQTESPERGIAALVAGEIQSARGTVVAAHYTPMRPRPRFEATLADADGEKLAITWFNGAYLRTRIHPGLLLRVRGKVNRFRGLPQMVNPKWEVIEPEEAAHDTAKFQPIYPATTTLRSETIATIIAEQLDRALESIEELFDPALLKRRRLLPRREAYRLIHAPASPADARAARRRIVYDELMLLQLALGLSKQARDGRIAAPRLRIDRLLDERIRARFPFSLTAAQERTIHEIVGDLKSGRPMNRLLQGDVGSGKTVVALYAMLLAVANKMQAAILTPTEVLAEQHFFTLRNLLRESSVRIELVTQRTKRQSRGELLRDIERGEVHLIIGTQAILQRDVRFANLGLIVIDEQHKLGVRQRASLKERGHDPHSLVMTATPIPRSLALSYFADFDLSVIDELPPGRKPIQTSWVRPADAERAYDIVRAQVAAKHQAYVVLPQIEDDGEVDSKSVRQQFARLTAGPFAGLRVAMLHGAMDADEKQKTMSAFRDRSIDVLVATTVIEVGVDVPNATVMLIDGAERFGLSQLHQLRGRVGRGGDVSHCVLICDPQTETAAQRINAFVGTNDGFKIAELDLQLRGPGEFFGTRQHGLPEMKLADITKEIEMLQTARDDAMTILRDDPSLLEKSHRALRQALRAQFGESIALAQVG